MRDARFILILAAVAIPVAGWLTFEALVAPDHPAKLAKAAKDKPLLVPTPAPQLPPAVEPLQSPVAAVKPMPPRSAEATASAAARKREGKSKTADVSRNPVPADVPPNAESNTPAPAGAVPVAPPPPAIQGKPQSPEELCADRANFVTRSLCEARACSSGEWSAHPTCVKRRELEERNRPASIMGGGG